MTKIKTRPTPQHCVYSDFSEAIHPAYRQTLPNLIQRSKRGTFPKFVRLTGKSSPALFDRRAILEWAETTFGSYFPETVEDMRKALGLPKTWKRP